MSTSLEAADEAALNELTEQLSQFNWKDGVVDRAKRLLYSADLNDNIKGAMNLKAMLCIRREEVYELAQEVIDAGVISRLVEFLKIDERQLQWPAAFCLTNVAAGLDAQTQKVVEAGAVEPLIGFLRHRDPQLRRQAIFCLANIAGSTPEFRAMLVHHPDYFPALFAIADDTKVLELICWNLRNVCLLGGLSFEEVKPGILFMLNRILKKYWNFAPEIWSFAPWSSCLRFAMETLTAACRTPQGRAALLPHELLPCLLHILEKSSSVSPLIAQAALEATAWILCSEDQEGGGGRLAEKELFVRHPACSQLIGSRWLTATNHTAGMDAASLLGTDGGVRSASGFEQRGDQSQAIMQDLALRSFASIALEMGNEREPSLMIELFEANPHLLDVVAQILSFEGRQTLLPSTRESAGFVFVRCLLIALSSPVLLAQVFMNKEVLAILLEVLEFAAGQPGGVGPRVAAAAAMGGVEDAQMEAPSGGASSVTSSTAATAGSTPRVPIGPPMPRLPNLTVSSCLRALSILLEHGGVAQRREGLPENPVLRLTADLDAAERLRFVLSTGACVVPDVYQIGSQILTQLSAISKAV